jgi:predicted DNA-binding transcriptional regulator AlpA
MRTDTSELGTNTPAIVPRSNVSLSKWVNEKLPAWNEILGAHEVARLTRRPRWILGALALVGRFPKPQRFHGRAIGWHRRDVQRWLLDTA